MSNSSSFVNYTEGVGGKRVATYRFEEDGNLVDVERIAPGCGVLLAFDASHLNFFASIGALPATQINCKGKARIVVKFRGLSTEAQSISYYLVFKAADDSIIGTSALNYATFTPVLDGTKNIAVAGVFANDVGASSVYIYVMNGPGTAIDAFIGAI